MDQQQQSRWQPTRTQLLWAGGIATLAFLTIVICGYIFGWKWTGLPKQTLWDWLQLLIIPAVLAGGGIWFNRRQQARSEEVENQRAQDAELQAYLDQLTQLLVTQRDHRLIRMRIDDEVREVIQARSEPLLRSLNPTRSWSLILFLGVTGLLAKDQPLVNLAGTDLRGVNGRRAPLRGVDLVKANLQEAHLEGALLGRANLSGADLSGADLHEADLSEINLARATLTRANLRGAGLRGAYLSEAYLIGTYLSGAYLGGADLRGAGLSEADLGRTNLNGADLSEANLSGADLSGASLWADLSGADLRGADLSEATLCVGYLGGADLRGANLKGTTRIGDYVVTNEELEQQTSSLEGATMPNGQKYEDWLKSKGRGKDGENNGPT